MGIIQYFSGETQVTWEGNRQGVHGEDGGRQYYGITVMTMIGLAMLAIFLLSTLV